MRAYFCGFSLAVGDNEVCYVPIGHRDGGTRGGGDLFAPNPQLCAGQIPEEAALAAIKPLLEDPGVLKVGQNIKYDWLIFALRGIDTHPCDDTMLMSYVLDAGRGDHGMDDLSEKLLGHKPSSSRRLPAPGNRKRRSIASLSRRRRNTPPRTPTSRCGCGAR